VTTSHLPPPIAELVELPEGERRLGPFRLVQQLGHGGFAPVWLAKEVFGDAELRTVAVKLFSLAAHALDPERASQASAAARHKDQVIHEAKALCKVEHPNVVRFYSIAVDEARGVVGLGMEYVTGTPLDRKIADAGKLPVDVALEVGIAVASALAAVHRAGLVHRDVKPSNVVEADGVYKLIDFGIASAETDAAEGAAARPRKQVVLDDLPFEVVGTKMSMLAAAYTVRPDGTDTAVASSPLFVSGTVGYIDPVVVSTGVQASGSSDLYGLGSLLYECLSGKVPACASARHGSGLAGDVLDGRSRARPVRELAPEVPDALAKIVDALVGPTREERPASAESVASELRRLRDEGRAPTLPVAYQEPPASQPAPSPVRAWVALVGVVVVAATVLGVAKMKSDAAARAAAPTAPSAKPDDPPCSPAAPSDCTAQCDRGVAPSCYTLGLLYENGNGVPRDVAGAAAAYAKGCVGGSPPACYASGRLLEAQKDFAAALDRYADGCTKGSAQACSSVGRFYSEGIGVEKDPAVAKGFYERACSGGYGVGCSNLGVLYERGQGVDVDLDRARSLYQEACDHGAPSACGDLAHFYVDGVGVDKDEARAAALYQKGCDGGNEFSCEGLGLVLAAGRGLPKDEARAAQLLKGACDGDRPEACASLADLTLHGIAGAAGDPTRAAPLFQRACDAHVAAACKSLGDLYAKGLGVPASYARATELWREACDGGAPSACATSTPPVQVAPTATAMPAQGVSKGATAAPKPGVDLGY
jgi:TPR repeat protein/serine/threonine protein kinase